MKCNLIVQLNEVTVRDYTLIEDAGLRAHIGTDFLPGISCEYEDDEESEGKQMLVIAGDGLAAILKFLDFVELPVKIIT